MRFTNNSFEVEDLSLIATCQNHIRKEYASFHVPGHKGKNEVISVLGQGISLDLTELVLLDDLYDAKTCIAKLEYRLAQVFNAAHTIISVNGASAAIIAALTCIARLGTHVIVPRNAHQSVISGLILTGLEPIWVEPFYNSSWGLWCEFDVNSLDKLNKQESKPVAMIITSPTYAGSISNIEQISVWCKKNEVILIVDEAHGAHLSISRMQSFSGLACGADLVIHSLSKTLTALTQSAVLHVNQQCLISKYDLKNAVRLISSSSPSYLLMASIEEFCDNFEKKKLNPTEINLLRQSLDNKLQKMTNYKLYSGGYFQDPWHVLIKHNFSTSHDLNNYLINMGIYPETCLGDGVLLMLGLGSTGKDIELLVSALKTYDDLIALPEQLKIYDNLNTSQEENSKNSLVLKPAVIEQAMSMRQAYFAKHKLVKSNQAIGFISGQYVSYCPPGIPLCVPGQKITASIATSLGDCYLNIVDLDKY